MIFLILPNQKSQNTPKGCVGKCDLTCTIIYGCNSNACGSHCWSQVCYPRSDPYVMGWKKVGKTNLRRI